MPFATGTPKAGEAVRQRNHIHSANWQLMTRKPRFEVISCLIALPGTADKAPATRQSGLKTADMLPPARHRQNARIEARS
jgi:hypothetical protein